MNKMYNYKRNKIQNFIIRKIKIIIRKIKIIICALTQTKFRQLVKLHINLAYRRKLLEKSGVGIIDPMDLTSFDKLDFRLSGAACYPGNTTYLEMMCILGLVRKYIDNGKNFLEIGTFDGNMARNVAQNIGAKSKVITIDLPEDSNANNPNSFTNELILSNRRKQKKNISLTNVEQIWGDSTKLDFSKFDFHGAFIDGGHDFETVRVDTFNVLNNIKKPGFVAWHDYEMESDIGDLIFSLLSDYKICYVEGTRMAILELR